MSQQKPGPASIEYPEINHKFGFCTRIFKDKLMKTRNLTYLALALLAAFTLSFTSCSRFGRSKGQNIEFATFIKAYTGGVISDRSTVCVELASDVPGAIPGTDLKDGVLTFTPSLKGTTRWVSTRMIEFLPENGALKPGQSYTAKLRLDKIQKVSGRQFRKFSFNFLVAIKEAVLSMDKITITAASPDKASIEGSIALTESLPLETVQKMLEYDYANGPAEVNVTAGSDPLNYHFELLNLQRDEKDHVLKVSLNPGETGFVTDSKLETSIPAMGDFKVLSAEYVETSDPYIEVFFTEALEKVDDDSGIFTLDGASRFYVQVENCHARIYFENRNDEDLTLTISETLKSYNGDRLGEDFTKVFTHSEDRPAVEIPITGNILPNSRELILPFKAVNLKAVDIKIIQIYEENVLMFLQDNNLDGDNSIRRSGRLIYKRSIRLDSDPSKNIRKWQNYSVDLSGLFKQEAGAIYRIKISFKQEYSVYGQDIEFKSGAPSDELVDISTENMTEDDDAQWDRPYPHYYEDSYDWSKYVWQDRDNPNKPTYYMDDTRFPSINLLTSNLGVIAKHTGGDRIWVSVSDILSTDPVFNAELYVYSYQLKEIGYAKTGTDGMADIPLSGKPFVVVAKRGGATSYLKVTEGEEKSLSRFDVGGKMLDKGLKAYIYGERGVWKPGDTLHVSMILEDKEQKIPDDHPAILELYTPQGQFYTKIINSNGKNGFYVYDIPTKDEDPTGTWNAYVKIGGASFHKALMIENVKPNRLKINTSIGNKTISGGEKMPVEVSANWLTGPAAAGLQARMTMSLRPGPSTFKGFEEYSFTNRMSQFTSSEHELLDTRLDGNGKAVVNVAMPQTEGAPGMLSADFLTTVEEHGGDVSFNSVRAGYSPYSSYVGIRIPKEKEGVFLETDKDYQISVATVDKDGKRVTGSNISYSIYKIEWSWWWESSSESLDSYVNSPSSQLIDSGRFKSGPADNVIPFKIEYPQWGRYLILVYNEDSGHACADIVYVDWPAYRGKSSKTDPNALTMLSFSTDKKTYDVGETVSVYIPASAKGQALVSLENSRTVISREWVKTTEGEDAVYKFKVSPEMAPNFYIHITLIQPHERPGNDLPIRLYGVQPVLVNDKESRLEPMITMPDVIRPEKEFTVKIKEKSGKSMSYTLAIVDEGLLDLTAFKTPDPWKAMYEREALGVRTWDLYDKVIGAYSGRFSPMFSIGGDQSIQVGAKKDNRFNPVVKFLGPFSLQNGSAVHKITLPTYIGSVRVMVVAAKDGAYGKAEKTVPVRSPLMVLPTLPRVLGTGEKVTLPVNVFALEDNVKSAEVSVKVEGPLSVTGESGTTVRFDKPGDRMVRFFLEATGSGTAKVTVNAKGGGQNTSQTISIQVRNPNLPVTTVSRAVIGAGETKHFGFSPFEAGDDNWATLELAGFPSVDYKRIFDFFAFYKFDCTEQIAAKGISLLAIKEMLPEELQKSVEEQIPGLVQRICQRQLSNGGFAHWPGVSDADNWVSSMAGQFLIAASQNGFSVSKGVIASWSRFQKKEVQGYRNSGNGHLWDLEQAYRLYTLALASEPESGAMNRLKESESLSLQASWMLASAYAVSGKKTVAKEMIAQLKTDFSDYTKADRTFASPVRDKAIAMEALVLADEIPGAMDIAGEIAKAMDSGLYITQEAAFSSNAFARLAGLVGDGTLVAEITQGDKTEKIRSAKSVLPFEADTQTGGLDVKNLSESVLHATFSTSMTPDFDKKVAARSEGLNLSVTYTSENGQPLNPAEIQQGTDFYMSLTVGNTSGVRDYEGLALYGRIASGWEIVNDRLFGLESKSPVYDYKDIKDDGIVWYFNLSKGTSKTFKVKLHASYEGEFVLPAAKCEAMYNPVINANSASGLAKVTR